MGQLSDLRYVGKSLRLLALGSERWGNTVPLYQLLLQKKKGFELNISDGGL